MNYCDENGCQNRKRNYVEGNDLIADVSKSLPSDIEVGKATSELSEIADKEAER